MLFNRDIPEKLLFPLCYSEFESLIPRYLCDLELLQSVFTTSHVLAKFKSFIVGKKANKQEGAVLPLSK